MTMKNAVFWDIKSSSYLTGDTFLCYRVQPVNAIITFEVFTAVTMKNAVYLDVTLCAFCKNLGFGGKYSLHHQGNKKYFFAVCFSC
jgi:hypothetical protein